MPSFEVPDGWIFASSTKEAIRESGENLTKKYIKESPSQISKDWSPLDRCFYRDDILVINFKRRNGAFHQNIDLYLKPGSKEPGHGTIRQPKLNRDVSVVEVIQSEFPNFLHYFEFKTVSQCGSNGENLSWRLGLMKEPPIRSLEED